VTSLPELLSAAPTAGGAWLVAVVAWPVIALMLVVMGGERFAARVGVLTLPVGTAIAAAVALCVARAGAGGLVYHVGGWAPPLGIALRADGLSAAMLLVTAVVASGAGVYALADFGPPRAGQPGRRTLAFWVSLLGAWAALNLAFLGNDLFNLYVALELLTFAAVPLVCLDGSTETLRAALRYLLYALAGSVLYLLGAVLLYGAYGTLDVGLLARAVRPEPAAWTAAGLMTAGLLAKTALFPLHLWLPPAHAGAPPAASAVLSALVVKGSFFIVLRLWFEALPALASAAAMQLLGLLGAGAILYGSALALRQSRLKLLIAYSTVAQIGYLFLVFPLAFDASAARLATGAALTGGLLQAVSHALAKAAMFMSAGLIAVALGHDRIAGLGGLARARPASLLAFALAGVSLVGLPPSGGFAAKWLLLSAAVTTGQWWWAVVIVLGGLLTGAYLVLVLMHAMEEPDASAAPPRPVATWREAVPLALALLAVFMGLAGLAPAGATAGIGLAMAQGVSP
jgi:formate hydrogenlyase subunit 3/multisubunit Na+/H+ antiporter MnhD subunit